MPAASQPAAQQMIDERILDRRLHRRLGQSRSGRWSWFRALTLDLVMAILSGRWSWFRALTFDLVMLLLSRLRRPKPQNDLLARPLKIAMVSLMPWRRAQTQAFQAGVWTMLFRVEGWGSGYPGVALSKPPQKTPVEVATPRVVRSS